MLDGNDKPLTLDDEITFVGEVKFGIQIGHFFGGDIFRKMIDKILFCVGRFDDVTQTFDACFAPVGLNTIDGVEIFGNRNDNIGWNSRLVVSHPPSLILFARAASFFKTFSLKYFTKSSVVID